jgi:hypothetical protein
MTICYIRIACWIPKATNTHSEHVILIVFHSNNGYTNARPCFVISTLPVLLIPILIKILKCEVSLQISYSFRNRHILKVYVCIYVYNTTKKLFKTNYILVNARRHVSAVLTAIIRPTCSTDQIQLLRLRYIDVNTYTSILKHKGMGSVKFVARHILTAIVSVKGNLCLIYTK